MPKMVVSPQPPTSPRSIDLQDPRAPRRTRALRVGLAVAVLSWLAFAALLGMAPVDDPQPSRADTAFSRGAQSPVRAAAPGASAPQARAGVWSAVGGS
jgi:hypothetical protein